MTIPAVQVTISRPQIRNLFEHFVFGPFRLGQRHRGLRRQQQRQHQPIGGLRLALGNNPSSGTNNLADAIQIQGGGGAININVPHCGVFSDSTDCISGLTLIFWRKCQTRHIDEPYRVARLCGLHHYIW